MIIQKLSDRPDHLLENSPRRGNRWPDSLPGLPVNEQEMAQLEADIQPLVGVLTEVFPPKVNWSKVELCTLKGGQPKASVEHFAEAFQRHTHSSKLFSSSKLSFPSLGGYELEEAILNLSMQ